MTIVPLYTGGGVSLSPQDGEWRNLSGYVRLVAEEKRYITDGITVTICVDIPKEQEVNWADCDSNIYDEELTAEEALEELREVLE